MAERATREQVRHRHRRARWPSLTTGIGVLALCASLVSGTRAQAPGETIATKRCAVNLANSLRTTGSATEVITVEATGSRSTFATVNLWQSRGGCFFRSDGPFAARLGFNGLSADHLEGDGTTPMGSFTFGPVIYGALADPALAYRYHQLRCGDWWDEDPRSASYNQFVAVGCGKTPAFGGGSEPLWQVLPAYDYFAVINYNSAPVVADKGSAIFLHLGTSSPTNGCVSLAGAALLETLRWLRPAAAPRIVIGTRSTITNY